MDSFGVAPRRFQIIFNSQFSIPPRPPSPITCCLLPVAPRPLAAFPLRGRWIPASHASRKTNEVDLRPRFCGVEAAAYRYATSSVAFGDTFPSRGRLYLVPDACCLVPGGAFGRAAKRRPYGAPVSYCLLPVARDCQLTVDSGQWTMDSFGVAPRQIQIIFKSQI